MLSCLLLALAGLGAEQTTIWPVSYELNVRIEPAQGSIHVRAKLGIPQRNRGEREVRFDLHETFEVKRLLVDRQKAAFSFQPAEITPVKPASRTLVVRLPAEPLPDPLPVEIEYEGRLKDLPENNAAPGQPGLDDQINARMVELASYSSWYPQFPWGQPLRVELELSLPQGWVSVCSGQKLAERMETGRALTRWSSPNDVDVLVLASPHYRKREGREAGVAIEIYDTQLPPSFIDREAGQIAGVLTLFTGRLGQTTIPGGTVKHVFSPKRKGQGMAGIARPGIIATSEGITLESLAAHPDFSLFQGIAHEIAHFWWNFGSGQGDWVNEAFSEYFSAVAVQVLVSEERFGEVMASYRRSVAELPSDAPSLSLVPFRDGQVNWVVRYQKGALMLDRLRRALGDEAFFAASRDFFQVHRGHSIGTAEFRGFWKQRLGDQAELVDALLDAGGASMPSGEPHDRGDGPRSRPLYYERTALIGSTRAARLAGQ
jgi:peptidase M1-like protein